MWERSINLWLRPPPWGENCHSQYCIPLAASSKASCCLLTEELHCNVSVAVALPQVPRQSIISLVAYSRLNRMDEKQREIKVILVLGAIYRV